MPGFSQIVLKVLWCLTVLVVEGVTKLCPDRDTHVLVPGLAQAKEVAGECLAT